MDSQGTDRPFCVGDEVVNDKQGWAAKVVEVDVKLNRIKLKQNASAWYDLDNTSFTVVRHAPVKAEYKPGDVVEFEYRGVICEGMMFINYCESYGVAFEWKDTYIWECTDAIVGGFRKIGHTEHKVGEGGGSCNDAINTAKAYFSPTFTGTYAERQEQWIEHHGIKVGSKVKVVRKFEEGADGSVCMAWDSTQAKAGKQGRTCYIRTIHNREIVLCSIKGETQGCGIFPYTALEPA